MGMTMKAAAVLLAAQALLAQAQTTPTEYSATLIESSKAWGTVIADFNRDGHDDIFITGHDKNDRIWYWTAEGYVPSTQVFKWSDRHDCDAADINNDGLLDMYCAVGAEQGTDNKSNEFWIQNPNGKFRDGNGWGARDPNGRSRRPLFFDLDHDGFPDLYDTNFDEPRTDGKPNINHVYRNRNGKGFDEVLTLATGPRGSGCVAKGDVDNDGWEDLLVCDEAGPGHIYLNNQQGDFTELVAPGLSRWVDAKLVDVNNDGLPDLVALTYRNQFQIWLNSGGGAYYESPSFTDQLWVQAVSLAVGDFNLDGLKDVYVVLRDRQCLKTLHDLAPDLIYEGQADGSWLKTQPPQDYAGCGYMVDVVDGNKILLMNGGGDWVGPNYLIEKIEPPPPPPPPPPPDQPVRAARHLP